MTSCQYVRGDTGGRGVYPHAKGGSDRGMWITLFTPPLLCGYVDKFIWYCRYDMLDGRDDGFAVYDPNFNILPSLSSYGMAGDL